MRAIAVAIVLVALIWAASTQLAPWLTRQRELAIVERELAVKEREVTIVFLDPSFESPSPPAPAPPAPAPPQFQL